MKLCRDCGEMKPLDAFHKNKRQANGRQSYCRPCSAARHAADYQANREKRRATQRRYYRANQKKLCRTARLSNYGLSPADFERMNTAQEGRCAICRRTTPGNLFVDHDHQTGAVRGLLCRQCNYGLGNFKDSDELLVAARAYLAKHHPDRA